MTILEQLPIARLRFDLEALESTDVAIYKGDMLRRALLWWLSAYWCPMPTRCQEGCRRPDTCMFGKLCEPVLDPAWPTDILRLVGNSPPPAYALWDLQDRRKRFEAGMRWGFELVLIGETALRQIPAIGAAVQEGAERGMGREKLRSRIRRVSAVREDPLAGVSEHVLAEEKPQGDDVRLTWNGYSLDDVRVSSAAISQQKGIPSEPVRQLQLRFTGPVKIKERGNWVSEPRFSPIAKAVVRRLRILSVVHGGGEWPKQEYGPLLDLADRVRLDHHETTWTRYDRWSKASGKYDVGGFVGQAWYSSDDDLRPLLPALRLGQWLHIGKQYVLGCGRYELEC